MRPTSGIRAADPKRIDVSNIRELRSWSTTFGVTQQELLSAVRLVGDSPVKVREYFRRRDNASGRAG
ncbi:MAG TPA: DUF3606 domain-containing protein [Burkholderiales bacterium]|nr:DUF3606 domain-containing protein [Burkholderiales bacterium]